MTPPAWKPRTKHDELAAAGELPPKGSPLVECPGCRRRVNAELLLVLPPAARAAIGTEASHGCDGCRTHWHRTGRIGVAELHRHLGAPAAHCARMRAKHGAR